jgi:polar amino acid transport system permease protein
MTYVLQFGQVTQHVPYLLGGAFVTLQLALVSFGFGFVIGLTGAACRAYAGVPVRAFVDAYVWLFTNAPTLITLLFLFNGLPEAGILLSPFAAAAIGLTLVAGAYLTEIMRAGFTSARRNEIEAAEVLGFSRLQIIRDVITPHLIRTIYPPLSGFFITMVLGSSLAALIGVEELTGRAINISASTLRSIEIFLIVAGIYVALTLLASALLALVGRVIFRVKVRVI